MSTVVIANFNNLVEQVLVAQGISQGASAYDVAVTNGFVGTEAAWLESLHDYSGDTYVAGENIAGHSPVYIGSDGKLYTSSLNDIMSCKLCCGVSNNAAALDGSVTITKNGGSINYVGWSFTPGNPVYIGNGIVSATDTNTAFLAVLGFSSSATSIVVKPQPIIIKG